MALKLIINGRVQCKATNIKVESQNFGDLINFSVSTSAMKVDRTFTPDSTCCFL